jgi:hypothetical protein
MRLVALSLLVIACGDEPAPNCFQLEADCSPLYEPIFEQVYTNTLARSCGVGIGSCHAATGAKGDLVLDDADIAHAQLMLNDRVIPGDAACSMLIKRLDHETPSLVMPPGAKLSAAEICSVRKWIEAGAQR